MVDSSPSTREVSQAVKCYAECPHFQRVSGRCTHDDVQVLRNHFIENPDVICPVYDEWRAEQMAILERQIEAE